MTEVIIPYTTKDASMDQECNNTIKMSKSQRYTMRVRKRVERERERERERDCVNDYT